jgi:site-specific DNA recombinase
MEEELRKYTPRQGLEPLLKTFLSKAYHQQTGRHQEDRQLMTTQIKDLEGKLSKARDLLLSDQIDPADYRTMKSEYDERLNRLRVKLDATATQTDDFDTMLKQGLGNLFRLSEIYENGSIIEKRRVIGSVYPEKLTFDGDQLRTTRVNEAVRLIYTLDKGFPENEKGQSGNIPALSSQVGKTGFEPATPWSQTRCATGLRYFPIRQGGVFLPGMGLLRAFPAGRCKCRHLMWNCLTERELGEVRLAKREGGLWKDG